MNQTNEHGEAEKRGEFLHPFFVVIPDSVLKREDLLPHDKLVFGEIMALSRRMGFCFATNEHIAESLGVNIRTIQRSVKALVDVGLVKSAIKRDNTGTFRQISVVAPEWFGDTAVMGGVTPVSYQKRIIQKEYNTVAQKKTVGSLKESVASKAVDNNIKSLFSFYEEQYVKRIDDAKPHFSWGVCAKLAKPLFKRFSLEELKRMVVAFLSTDNAFYRSTAWSLRTFLRDETINTLKSAIR